MPNIFTDYIRRLGKGQEPGIEDLKPVFAKLRAVLRKEMQRRSLWSAPPRYLGVLGWDHWQQAGALDELASDCYLFNFVDRQAPLYAMAMNQDNIEGTVLRNVRNFLFEKQRKGDPVGYRVFFVLRAALRKSLDVGCLHVLAGSPKVQNATLLAFEAGSTSEESTDHEVARAVAPWSDRLLPELIEARGKQLEAVIEAVRECVAGLIKWEIWVFRFKNVIAPFKTDVRSRWTAWWETSEGEWAYEDQGDETLRQVRREDPPFEVEDPQVLERLIQTVTTSIGRLSVRAKTKRYLQSLWGFLARQSVDPMADPLSQRDLAERLAIPRYRLPELLETLAGLVQEAQAAEGAPRDAERAVS